MPTISGNSHRYLCNTLSLIPLNDSVLKNVEHSTRTGMRLRRALDGAEATRLQTARHDSLSLTSFDADKATYRH